MTRTHAIRAGALASAVALVAWVRMLPLSLGSLDAQAIHAARQDVIRTGEADHPATGAAVDQWIARNRPQFERMREEWRQRLEDDSTYRGADGRAHVYLGDYDSYTWLRHARTYLRTGTTCDVVRNGECRDTFTNAPVGRRDRYHRSLHIAAIAGLHRMITLVARDHPLPASAFLVPVIVGILGVFPAFAVGSRLGGTLAGWSAAVLIGTNPIFLQRSIGSDTDVWNVVLPLFALWAGSAALSSASLRGCLVGALMASLCTAVHAWTWSGWVLTGAVLFAGMLGNLLVLALRSARSLHGIRVGGDSQVHRALLVLLVFCAATALATTLSGVEQSWGRAVIGALTAAWQRSGPAAVTLPSTAHWPDAFATVGELSRPNLRGIADFLGGPLFFFVGWLGLLVLVLPRRAWQWWHFLVLISGNFLYRYLLTAADLPRALLVGLLAMPLVVALALFTVEHDGDADGEHGAALTVVVWFLAALFLSYGGVRFVMLLVPPFAIACAVALGRLHAWMVGRAQAASTRGGLPTSIVLGALLVALLLQPVRRGYDAARTYRPRINDAWWDTLEQIRTQTPTDAIVNTWWDYGYWVKYVAERRVSADGGSLGTHIIHWFARALAATNEGESIGLLRMLNCRSDATPEPEGHVGAYGQLRAHGFSEEATHTMILELSRLDPAAAQAHLTNAGLSEAATANVLAASYCAAPPALLVLSSEMIRQPAWRLLGSWDPQGTHGPAPGRAYLTPSWRSCQPGDSDGTLVCAVGVQMELGTRLESVIYLPERPQATRIRLRLGPVDSAGYEDQTPALVLLASETRVDAIWLSDPTAAAIAILIDAPGARVLVGSPDVLRSTFTQLMYLDGRASRYFNKVDDRTSATGERVATWSVDWAGHEPGRLRRPPADPNG